FAEATVLSCFFFFFQAEDGIRDFHVTGVQTCALPIYGLMGVYLYLIIRRAIEPEVSKGLLAMIGISVLISILDPRINLIAHLGGLVTGFLLTGILLRLKP